MSSAVRMMAVTTAVLLSASALSGCGASTQTTPSTHVPAAVQPSPTQQFNDIDVQFVQQMIVHHQQALMMAQMAADKAADADVKQLAVEIEQEQTPEIEQMSTSLAQWGKPAPSMGPGMAMPSMPMGPGMMPSMGPMPDMGQMQNMAGEQFDRMFLQMMIAHHEGAVAMAEAEIAGGADPAVMQLAEKIQASQSAQIEQMRQMLGATPSPTS
ncbi:DUF305 domain-containing protein [Catellatospora sichuanensis]|uniref:DUF305 domain-containing protein n=1 Tax=Catellatospora sichuanensis TaxID=1969805 RepID=UPI001184472F|nr:DUF305 domain-containing protein [Catellatospora sichuanensis]